MPRLLHSLSARLLLLTILFVMIAEVLIYTPSIARFRQTWLMEKLAAAHLAALATVDAPGGMVTEEVEHELLDHVMAYRVFMNREGQPMYALGMLPPSPVTHVINLDEAGPLTLVIDAFETMAEGGDRVARLVGTSPRDPTVGIEVIFDETPLCQAMLDFSVRILGLSIIISLITAGLVFLAIRWLAIRPLMRITDSLMRFREHPERLDSTLIPSRRADEVGVAERELREMQTAVRSALRQQSHLAALGTAVTKINHDLRNMLASASLMSERLTSSDDPEVRRAAPQVLESIDRAVDLCGRTLEFAREEGPPVVPKTIDLREVVSRAEIDVSGVARPDVCWFNEVPTWLRISADADQLRRVFANLGSNAFQAGASMVRIVGDQDHQKVVVTMTDDGPGLPPRARQHLFQPFAGSARPGGTGLGLAIAREIVSAHGGTLSLDRTGSDGTTFRITLPG